MCVPSYDNVALCEFTVAVFMRGTDIGEAVRAILLDFANSQWLFPWGNGIGEAVRTMLLNFGDSQ